MNREKEHPQIIKKSMSRLAAPEFQQGMVKEIPETLERQIAEAAFGGIDFEPTPPTFNQLQPMLAKAFSKI